MTEEDVSGWVMRYRSTITEEPASSFDEAILRAARRRAVHVRTMRRAVVVLALAAVVIWPFWRLHVVRVAQAREVSGYGRQEGATRYYLLNVGRSSGSGVWSRDNESP